jgi:hypothetical protein
LFVYRNNNIMKLRLICAGFIAVEGAPTMTMQGVEDKRYCRSEYVDVVTPVAGLNACKNLCLADDNCRFITYNRSKINPLLNLRSCMIDNQSPWCDASTFAGTNNNNKPDTSTVYKKTGTSFPTPSPTPSPPTRSPTPPTPHPTVSDPGWEEIYTDSEFRNSFAHRLNCCGSAFKSNRDNCRTKCLDDFPSDAGFVEFEQGRTCKCYKWDTPSTPSNTRFERNGVIDAYYGPQGMPDMMITIKPGRGFDRADSARMKGKRKGRASGRGQKDQEVGSIPRANRKTEYFVPYAEEFTLEMESGSFRGKIFINGHLATKFVQPALELMRHNKSGVQEEGEFTIDADPNNAEGSPTSITVENPGGDPVTFSPTVAPTASAEAVQDPHITNANGQHFQLHKSGRFNMFTVRDNNNMPVLSVKADMLALDESPCASSYIRHVDVDLNAGCSVSFRRGFSPSHFGEMDNESFQISNDQEVWAEHGHTGNIDLRCVQLTQLNACQNNKDLQADCRRFVVPTEYGMLEVAAGTSPNKKRHFLDVKIASMSVPSGMSASGLLWADQPQSVGDGC